MKNGIIIIGAGGHGKVVADIIIQSGEHLLGFLDDNLLKGGLVLGYPVLGGVDDLCKFRCDHDCDVKFLIGIGNNYLRMQIAQRYDIAWHTAVHPCASVAAGVDIGEGTVVMANAVINADTFIGKHSIINSGAIVEHDNNIGDFAHISPGAAIGGSVNIGKFTHIGIGAVVKNNISIASETVIGAGAVVVKNISEPEKGVYIGVPAVRKKGNG